MKILMLTVVLLGFLGIAYAQETWGQDVWGHRTKTKNLWGDTDGDGVKNIFDRRDDNPRIW
jgi:hypothetical protein